MPENRSAIIQKNQGHKTIVFRSTVAKFIFFARKKTRWSSGSRCFKPVGEREAEKKQLRQKTISSQSNLKPKISSFGKSTLIKSSEK